MRFSHPAGGQENIKKILSATCPAGEPPVFIEGAGHWIQQEKPAEVTGALFAFANKHKALFSNPSKL